MTPNISFPSSMDLQPETTRKRDCGSWQKLHNSVSTLPQNFIFFLSENYEFVLQCTTNWMKSGNSFVPEIGNLARNVGEFRELGALFGTLLSNCLYLSSFRNYGNPKNSKL